VTEMALKTLEIEFIDIPGVNIPVRPEVAYTGKNLFETQLYAQDNGFVDLDSPESNIIAYFVRPETPKAEWVKQQAEKFKVKRGTVENAYANLHDDIWKKYWIRTGEILAWPPYSKRIVNSELNRKSKKPILLRGYEVLEKSKGDYVIKGGKVIEVDWPKENVTIPKNLLELLNAKDDTYIWTNPNPEFYEGLRALAWHFRLRGGPDLVSVWYPWSSYSGMGSLLGRSADRGFIRVPKARYRELIKFGDKISSLNEEWQKLVSELHE